MSQIRAVIFDMGGVVVRLSSLADVLAGVDLPTEELWRRWILSDSVRRFESGRCTVDEFAADLIVELGVELDPADLIERFRGFPQGLFDGAAELVADVSAAGCITGVCSNTSALHWDGQTDSVRVQGLFDRCYLSYQLGLLKPDPGIYRHAIDDLGLAPSEIVFLDDNQVNVDGAFAVGMASALTKGPEQARAALVEFAVLR